MAQIEGLGHVGIYVDDLMAQRDFWSRVMGLTIADEDANKYNSLLERADKRSSSTIVEDDRSVSVISW